MNEPPLRAVGLAIVGCGAVGRKRAAALSGARLLYACDLAAPRAVDLARTINLNSTVEASAPRSGERQQAGSASTAEFRIAGCQAVTDQAIVLRDPAVEAVIVSTLNASLGPVTLAAVRAGKHVLVEKPGALTADELREVQDAAARSGVRVRLGYNHRFHPTMLKAHELVGAGAVGPLMFVRGRYGHGGRKGYDREWRADPKLSGGGELIDQGVHLIDLAGWFLGEFATVEGHCATYFWDMPVDDNAFLSLRTGAGQTAWLQVSCTEWKNMFSLEIYGRDGKIAIDGLGGSYGPERLTFYRMLPQMGPPETTVWEYPSGDASWSLETSAFLDDIRLGREPEPGLRAGIRTLEIVGDIYRRSGK
jgi:predicted dehydrogenase